MGDQYFGVSWAKVVSPFPGLNCIRFLDLREGDMCHAIRHGTRQRKRLRMGSEKLSSRQATRNWGKLSRQKNQDVIGFVEFP